MPTDLLSGKKSSGEGPVDLLESVDTYTDGMSKDDGPEKAQDLFVGAEKADMPRDLSFLYEQTKDKSDFLGSIGVLASELKGVPHDQGIALLKLHAGYEAASVVDKGWMSRTLRAANKENEEFAQSIYKQYGDTQVAPFVPIKITDVAGLGENIAFSTTSLLAGLGAAAPLLLIPEPTLATKVAAWGVGTVASGKTAYEMATYDIGQAYLEALNEQEALTPETEREAKKFFAAAAQQYGLWEAVPEAIGNIGFVGILTKPLKKMVGKSILAKIITKFGGLYGTELITEAITQWGQARIEEEAGLREKGAGQITPWQALKEVAPQTFLLTSIMGGAGSSAVSIRNKAKAAFAKETKFKNVSPEAKAEFEDHVDTIIREQQEAKDQVAANNEKSMTGEAPEVERPQARIPGNIVMDEKTGKPLEIIPEEGEKVKHPALMTEKEFNVEEGKGMGVSWKNAMKLPDGTIIESNTKEHGDMIVALEEEYDIPGSKMERGWTWKGFPKEQSYIGVPDVEKAKGSFYQAYKNKYGDQLTSKEGVEVRVKKPTLKDNLQERLAELKDDESKKAYLKESLDLVEEAREGYVRSIRKYKGDQLKEELAGMPSIYVTKEGGIAVDEAMEQLRGEGIDIKNESDLVEYLNDLEKRRAEIKGEIKALQPKKIVKTEMTMIKERLADIKRGIKEGKTQTLKEVKAVQSELVDMTKLLDPKDQAKFIKTIKNIQTTQQMEKAIDDLAYRMARVHAQTKKAKIKERIKKELDKTKPVRQGDQKVGKYDYQSNMFFKDVRRIWKLNQTAALSELEGMPDENLSETDLIKKRLLSLQANGAAASLNIYEQVLADVQMLKEYGEAAKDDQDFNKRVERRERVDAFLAGSDKTTGGKTFFLSKLKRGYLRGVGSTYSFLNALFGKKIANQYDPEINEAEKRTAVHYVTKRVSDKATEIYGEKNILRVFEQMVNDTFEVTEQTERADVKKLTRMQLIDIYNSIKNETTRESYNELYGEDQVNALMTKLDPKDMALGDLLQEEVQAYRDIMNKKSIEVKGEDLGFVENYWPRSSEFIKSVLDDYRVQGQTPRSVKERAKGKVIPKPQNAWSVFNRSIEEAEYTDKVSNEYETLKRILNDRDIEHVVTEKFGKEIFKALHNQVDASSLHGHMQFVDAISEGMTRLLNNWVKAKIFSPTVYLRQWGSTSNFMENMPADQWAKGFAEGIAHPKATFDYMWKTVPYLEARFHKGYKESLTRALDDAKRLSANQDAYSKGITALVRSGDVSAIIYGGYPYLKYLQSKEGGNLSEKAAVKQFVKMALKSQQSPFPASLSAFQRRGGATGYLSAFKNTSSQYLRKMADATIQYKNGEITLSQYSKVMTIYGMIQPILYVTTGYTFGMALKQLGGLIRSEDIDWELDKFLDDIITQLVVNPINALPIFSSIVKFATREMLGQKGYNIANLPMISDVETAIRKGYKEEKTFGDWVTIVGTGAEAGAAVPILTLKRIYNYLMGKDKGKSDSKVGKTL